MVVKRLFSDAHNLMADRQFKGLLGLVGVLLLAGALFYTNVEHWSLLNSLYFCIVTLTTVGYGDFTPHTDAGKIFTMAYIIIGVGIILGFVNVIAKHATKRYMHQSAMYVERSEKFIERIVERVLEKQKSEQ